MLPLLCVPRYIVINSAGGFSCFHIFSSIYSFLKNDFTHFSLVAELRLSLSAASGGCSLVSLGRLLSAERGL